MLIPEKHLTSHYSSPTPIAKVFVGVCDDGTVTLSAVCFSANNALTSPSYVSTEEERERASVLASVARTRRLVRNYGLSNKFMYWATFTFSEKVWGDEKAMSKFTEWIRNHAYYTKQKVIYLMVVVPNQKDGWHVHALLRGIPRKELYAITPDMEDITADQRSRICQGMTIYKWSRFDEKYGTHHELVRIGSLDEKGQPIDQRGKVLYMLKQYDKLSPEKVERVKRRVYATRGLNKPKVHIAYLTYDDLLDLLAHCGVKPGKFGASLLMDGGKADEMLEHLYHLPSYVEDDKDKLMPT